MKESAREGQASSEASGGGSPKASAPELRVLQTAEVPEDVLDRIHRLLVGAFEEDFTGDDWEHTLGGRHFIVLDGDEVVAHAAVVPRVLHVGERSFRVGYVEGVGTAPARRGEGLGSLAMRQATSFIRGNFEMGGLGTDRFTFYGRLGWERWRGPTYVRSGSEVVRTPEEDGYVMVLRFGPSRAADITAPISCEERSGDDW